ncbi:MAG: IPT/TIG domain-containing protein [Gemmatimonadota bacterium]|nr:IPT/TIG domain-containing protein [Gemmatimonadota bacterium]
MARGPVITRLEPARGPAGVAYPLRLTIEGTGFAPESNTVHVGPVVLPDVPSADGGTRIVVFVPKEIPSTGEVPPAPLLPGRYEVSVTTAHGTSAPAIFTLTPEPGSGA